MNILKKDTLPPESARICQNPRQQWYEALLLMANHLINGVFPSRQIKASCLVLTKETYPLAALQEQNAPITH